MRVHTIFRRQRGFTLTEALIAFGITATGLLTVVSFQADLFTNSAYNKARTEALALAEQKIEQFKHYTLADEDSFIDDNDDGVMDADGSYADNPITGQNAVFTRSWDLASGEQAKQIDVTVSWTDSSNNAQSVSLTSLVPWISPRTGADQIAVLTPPSLTSPAGRAELGEGELADYPDVTLVTSPGDDGLSVYQNDENLLLVTPDDRVVLTLLDACNVDTGSCTDFVKISGTVYMDKSNTNQAVEDTYLIASDAAYCQRWVTSGSLSSPPETDDGDYAFFKYACYLGGGWHGNVGLVTAPGGIQQTDKVCQGDPTSLNAWEQPVIALRRAYRGMLSHTVNGETVYESHGIKDATALTGHDFVFTSLAASATEGSHCMGEDAPMTRTDSSAGALFAGVPTDFFCLNTDTDGDSAPDYLDSYDTGVYSADTYCPYDPTDPPVASHTISGAVVVLTDRTLDLSSFKIVTSDGPGNCRWAVDFEPTAGGYTGSYSCTVYDWGSGWTGYIQAQPRSYEIYCADGTEIFNGVETDQTLAFACIDINTAVIEGDLSIANGASVSAITITDSVTGDRGSCSFTDTSYTCTQPYDGTSVDVVLSVTSNKIVCGSVGGDFTYTGLSSADSPYGLDIYVEASLNKCP